jgi:hypothetical protein
MWEEIERVWHGHHPRATWGDQNECSSQIRSVARVEIFIDLAEVVSWNHLSEKYEAQSPSI